MRCQCKAVNYCNVGCQRANWRQHKEVCSVVLLKEKVEKERLRLRDDDVAVGMASKKAGEVLLDHQDLDGAEEYLEEALRIGVLV